MGRWNERAGSRRCTVNAASRSRLQSLGSSAATSPAAGGAPNRQRLTTWSGTRSNSGRSHQRMNRARPGLPEKRRKRRHQTGATVASQAVPTGRHQARTMPNPRSIASHGLRGRITAATRSRSIGASGEGEIDENGQPEDGADAVLVAAGCGMGDQKASRKAAMTSIPAAP